ncbi:molecular chaperone [Caenispirillum bisanense]|uniref:TorA specific chaperone n=1 Tax=Caenispirillum bisanense TaxID=414052 RepID=A0A286GDY3_9PROT|nr:molecular chaperone TorD family protein [Caenispirillum bisanense]SOD93702.1 TorA specific chaperone [Caenispirillum bisanense]
MTETPAPAADFAGDCLRRAELYRWFAGLLASRLDPVLLRAYRNGPGRAVLDNLRADPPLQAGAARMEAALDAEADDAALAKALARDFASLFEDGKAPPRASAWHDGVADVPEDAEAAEGGRRDPISLMKALLRRTGFGVRDSLPDAPDHVAVQLDVMAQLVAEGMAVWREAGGESCAPDDPALTGNWRQQGAFLDAHLLPWLPAFRDACTTHDPDGFYAGVAILLVAYVERDRAYVAAAEAAGQGGTDGTDGRP